MLNNLRPFLTGSYAYGIPKPNSDIDLVVMTTEDELEKLMDKSDSDSFPVDRDYDRHARTVSLRFGKLNLLCCKDEKTFEVWYKLTRELKKRAPVPRDFAVEYMGRRREELFDVELGDKGV